MNRKDILDAALKCVNGDRDEQYGSPEDSFKQIACYWMTYLNNAAVIEKDGTIAIQSRDVAAMLALLKIARIAGGKPKDDNWIDLAGYAACGGEIESCPCDSEKDKPMLNNPPIFDKDQFYHCCVGPECNSISSSN